MEEPALHLVQAFVAVVKHHNFAKAAQELKMTPSSVSRLVKTLENQIGVLLINRTTRAMSLTDAGQRYFSDSAVALEQLRQAPSGRAMKATCRAEHLSSAYRCPSAVVMSCHILPPFWLHILAFNSTS